MGDLENFSARGLLRVGIIGMGPRGLVVLDRLLAAHESRPAQRLMITLFEPATPGTGVHDPRQPGYLMLNTIAGQLAARPGEAYGFYEWCVMRNIRVDVRGWQTEAGGRPVRPTDYLPRRLLGEYLAWSYARLVERPPPQCEIEWVRDIVSDIEISPAPTGSGRGFTLVTEAGRRLPADRVFVTTGHGGLERGAGPYPLPRSVAWLAPDTPVAIAGFGLCAMDTLAALTIERGGVFSVREDGEFIYRPSGREPRIWMFSRSGMPYHARPETSECRERHSALWLTAARLQELRAGRPGGQLDFERDVLPLLRCEMHAAWVLQHMRLAVARPAAEGQVDACVALLSRHHDVPAIEAALAELAEPFGRFDAKAWLMARAPASLRGAAYLDWFTSRMRADIEAARIGLEESPLKAALEVVRELRGVLREAVNFGGLTAPSHRRFFTHYAGLFNRLVGGAQHERHAELLALIQAGIVQIFPGPNPMVSAMEGGGYRISSSGAGGDACQVSHIIEAAVTNTTIQHPQSGFLHRLFARRLLRPRMAVAGLDAADVDAEGHPHHIADPLARRIWIFGPGTEGSSFYNHYISGKNGFSPAWADAERAAEACLALPVPTRARFCPQRNKWRDPATPPHRNAYNQAERSS